jgi:hypothetical protein
MKRLLVLASLLLFLPAATAGAHQFETDQYLALENLVTELEAASSRPASDADRERAFAALEVAFTSASWSIDLVLEREVSALQSRAELATTLLLYQKKDALRKALRKINTWYRKNRDRRGALQRAEKRRALAEKRISVRWSKKQELLLERLDGKIQVLDLSAQLQQERSSGLLDRGRFAIEQRPEL